MAVKKLESHIWEKEVIKSRTPVVVNFWHKQCKWCRKLNPLFASVSKDFEAKFAQLDIRKSKGNLALAKKFGIMGTPTLVVFSNGRPIGTIIGYRNKEQLAGELDQFIRIAQDSLVMSTSMMYR